METPLVDRILQRLSQINAVTSLELANEFDVDHQKIIGAVKSLESLGNIITSEQKLTVQLVLTPEGRNILKVGSPEVRAFERVATGEGIFLSTLSAEFDTATDLKIGFNKAVQAGWLTVLKEGDDSKVVRSRTSVNDQTRQNLETLENGEEKLDEGIITDLKKRKLVVSSTTKFCIIHRGSDFSTTIEKQETELTEELLFNKEYENRTFRSYNFNAQGLPIRYGHLHPLQKVRAEFLTILTEMGFSEMPTNRFVESSFWNFDTLFVPQKHPARDVQDTFFMSTPRNCNQLPKEYMERVARVHSSGDFGSTGYGAEWKEEEARKNVLRTHTTAISARILYELAQNKPFQPVKKFSIDRVFRNETLDATHLAEFHQVEGFVADRNLSLGHLIGVMTEFFRRLGIEQLRFKPAYNPYTEPSMEVFAFHKGLKKWVEVGNSGVFRPEMLLPMGLPEDVRVIAWGLSLERPTMIRYGIDNIRTLVGPRVDLRMVYSNPLCRLDKVRQDD